MPLGIVTLPAPDFVKPPVSRRLDVIRASDAGLLTVSEGAKSVPVARVSPTTLAAEIVTAPLLVVVPPPRSSPPPVLVIELKRFVPMRASVPLPFLVRPITPPPVPRLPVIGAERAIVPVEKPWSRPSVEPPSRPLVLPASRSPTTVLTWAEVRSATGRTSVAPERAVRFEAVQLASVPP